MNKFVLNLLEAKVSLYPANADGTPVLTAPIYTGAQAENLTLREKWLKTETRPTGSPYPRKHPLVAQYEISIARIWELSLLTAEGGPAGMSTSPNYYVLDILWTDEDRGDWHRETFYNVTISDRSLASRDMEHGFTDELAFDAEYKAAPTGGTGAPPVVTSTLPYSVVWVGPDGTLPLFSYDPATFLFTALADTTTRATIQYSAAPTTSGSRFAITFGDPDTEPTVLFTTSPVSGHDGIELAGVTNGAPDDTVVPRLDFYYGRIRVASLGSDGTLYGTAFMDGAPSGLSAGQFQIYGNGVLAMTLAGSGIQAWFFNET